MGSIVGNNPAKGLIGLTIAGVVALVGIVMGGNALTSRSEGTVQGVIVDQWRDRDCRRTDTGRRCDTDYNNRVRLPNGDYRTFDRQSWYNHKNTGDAVTLEKRRGGWFGNVYYNPR